MNAKPSFLPPPRPRVKSRTPKRGRKTGTFGTYKRLTKLREALERQPGGLTLEALASALNVTTRSVRRYLEELARLVELESLPTEPGGAHLWRIKPSERGRALSFRRTQAYALLATRRQFEALKGSALYDEIDLVMRQLVTIAQRPAQKPTRGEIPENARLEERFLFLPDAPRRYENRAEDLDALFHAVADLRSLRCVVTGERALTIHPYALLLHRGSIVCVAHLPALREMRVLSFDDLGEIEVTTDHFTLPEGFDVTEWWQGDFGVSPPTKARERIKVLVEFDAKTASEVRFRKTHPSQRTAVASDGRVRLSLTVTDLDAAVRWVLGFGDGARVIEPPELVRAVDGALRRMLAKYIG
ncbi:MAG TPA: WYL domain-containing transcriptional regulator [Polyangiaceae bacterium]